MLLIDFLLVMLFLILRAAVVLFSSMNDKFHSLQWVLTSSTLFDSPTPWLWSMHNVLPWLRISCNYCLASFLLRLLFSGEFIWEQSHFDSPHPDYDLCTMFLPWLRISCYYWLASFLLKLLFPGNAFWKIYLLFFVSLTYERFFACSYGCRVLIPMHITLFLHTCSMFIHSYMLHVCPWTSENGQCHIWILSFYTCSYSVRIWELYAFYGQPLALMDHCLVMSMLCMLSTARYGYFYGCSLPDPMFIFLCSTSLAP